MNNAHIPNYLDSLSQGADLDAKPICMHGVRGVLIDLHIALKKSRKGNFVKSIKTWLDNSSRAYYSWIRGNRPIPIAKARKLVVLWSSLTKAKKSEVDKLWNKFYEECSGFSVDGGKYISLPKTMTTDLAYIIGVIFGDGCIFSQTRGKFGNRSRYGIQITESEEFLMQVVSPKLKHIFGIQSLSLVKGDGDWYSLILHSKVVHTFLKNVIKIPDGRKKWKLIIPQLVRQNSELTGAFLRGLFDTDGGISKVSSTKPALSLSQADDRFLEEVKKMLIKLGISFGGPYKSGSHRGHELKSYNAKTIKKFQHELGFRHPVKKQRLLYWMNSIDRT